MLQSVDHAGSVNANGLKGETDRASLGIMTQVGRTPRCAAGRVGGRLPFRMSASAVYSELAIKRSRRAHQHVEDAL